MSDQEEEATTRRKPPKRYWEASEPFFDLKASHWVEIALTLALVRVGGFQLLVYSRQANIMNKQAQIAGKQLVEMQDEQRAWLHFKAPWIEGSLTFKEDGAHLLMQIPTENIGHLPATRIWLHREGLVWKADLNLPSELKKFCDAESTKPLGAEGAGFTVFPGDMMPLVVNVNIPQTEIDIAMKAPPIRPDKKGFVGYILGCVDYGSGTNPIHHQTPFAYEIDKRTGGGMNDFVPIDPSRGPLTPDNITILINPYVAGEVR